MKKGKDDEKMMGPMFPRLHVNDTEKGGPRAPPRNKMALYEQLTIHSQRQNSGVMLPKRNDSGGGSLVPSTSSSQGTSRDQNMHFSLYQPSSTLAYEETQVRNRDAGNSSNHQVRVDNKRKAVEEDDFMVPIFSQARVEVVHGNTQNILDVEKEKHIHLSSNPQAGLPTTISKEANQNSSGGFLAKHLIKDREGRNMKALDTPKRRSFDISVRGRGEVQQENDTFTFEEHQCTDRLSSLEESGTCVQEDPVGSLPVADARYDEDTPDMAREKNPCEDNNTRLMPNPQAGYIYKGDDKVKELHDDHFMEKKSIDRSDDVSENSMVDSAFVLDITPDDVVDIIGHKHFWKARNAIVNQQRVFAVQVFELHRLLKVQKIIAGSPNLLVESSAFERKSSLKVSAVKNYSTEYVMKTIPQKLVQKVVVQKVSDKIERTAENAVPKASTPVPYQQNPIQSAGYVASPPPESMEQKMNPWGFHQPSAHQWLVPVMSPSEGLVYKPYPAPGFMGPVCGGCGPMGSPQIVGNFVNPSFGVGPPQQQQGMWMPPAIQFGGQSYFPPFGMPMISPSMSGSNVEQLNLFSAPNPYSQMGEPAGGSTNLRVQNHSNLNVASQENCSNASAANSLAPKEGRFKRITASSSNDAAQGSRVDPSSERRDALPLLRAPSAPEVPDEALPEENQARVIRVIPHRSTRESAARMFQSIQEERQHYESS